MTFVGFGLGDGLVNKPLVSATLELSLAGRGGSSPNLHDRILVRAYHAGRWEYLGETALKGDLSNAKRGGYLSFDLSSIGEWKDLSDLKVVVEYVREHGGDSAAYLDGIWVNAKYSADTLTDPASPEEVALSAANIRSSLFAKDAEARKARRDILVTPEGKTITFTHGDTHADAKLSLKTDRDTYHALGNTETFFNSADLKAFIKFLRNLEHFKDFNLI